MPTPTAVSFTCLVLTSSLTSLSGLAFIRIWLHLPKLFEMAEEPSGGGVNPTKPVTSLIEEEGGARGRDGRGV